MGKKKLFTKQEELDIINYYLTPFTLTETAHHFNLERAQVKRVLTSNNIQPHTKEINNQAKLKKTIETNMKKYGVSNTFQSPNGKKGFQNFYSDEKKVGASILKSKQTRLERYGDENYNNINQINQTRLEKYGVENFFQNQDIHNRALNQAKSNEAKLKKKQTSLEHFGVDVPLASDIIRQRIIQTNIAKYGGVSPLCSAEIKDKIRETNRIKYGKDYYTQTEEYKERNHVTWTKKTQDERQAIVNRVIETKRLNHSFNTSSSEEKFYEMLVNMFGVNDIVRQYKDEIRYPFNCDFYIKHLDMFIELNLFFSHGGHPFNEEDPNDIETLNLWKEKSQISQFYKNAIETWTVRDVSKLKTAQSNNLNYHYFYSLQEALDFLNYIN